MLRTLFATLLVLISCAGISQTSTLSPYSLFGLGDAPASSLSSQAGMGHTNLGVLSTTNINFANPATQTFVNRPTFSFDLRNEFLSLNDGIRSQSNSLFAIDNLSFGFPLINNFKKKRKAALSFGLQPRTRQGYDVVTSQSLADIGNVDYYFYGSGGLNNVNLSAAFDLIADSGRVHTLSIGVTASYVFGKLARNRATVVDSNAGASDIFRTEALELSDIDYRLGLLYSQRLFFKKGTDDEKNGSISIGAYIKPQASLRTFSKSYAITFLGPYYDPYAIDTLDKSSGESTTELPLSYGPGASFRYASQWTFAVDFSSTAWSSLVVNGGTAGLNDETRFSAGVEYIPDYTAVKKVFKIIRYRTGFSFEQTRVNINGSQPTKLGIHGGFGIPIIASRSSSLLNFGTEYAIRGGSGLPLSERFWNIHIGMTITPNQFDRWFQKRKYD